MLVLDTHVLLWHLLGGGIGEPMANQIEAELEDETLRVLAITFCEIAFLAQRRRVDLGCSVEDWHDAIVAEGVRVLPVTAPIAILAIDLNAFHKDPADLLIV